MAVCHHQREGHGTPNEYLTSRFSLSPFFSYFPSLPSFLLLLLLLLKDAFENAHLEYLERTDKRVSDFKHYTRINREREKDIERAVRGIERLQLQMQEIRNNMQLAARKFEDQRELLTSEKSTIQQQVSELRDKMRRFQVSKETKDHDKTPFFSYSRRGMMMSCVGL
jgi:hypothetical protein